MAIDPANPFNLEYTVNDSQNGLRLDRFVQQLVPTISRNRIQNYNKAGRILVNNISRPQNWKVRVGDQVILKCHIPEGGEALGTDIPVDIVYEDESILAVNKQPGLIVHPVSLHRHNTLMNALYWRYRDQLSDSEELMLVNRIDQYTSGLVLLSKNKEVKRNLQQQFESRSVSKEYLALVKGKPEPPTGKINLPIGAKENRVNRIMMGIRFAEEGRSAVTSYEVVECFENYSLVQLKPKTGRQHQLRVHLAHLGNPLLADHLYGDGQGVSAILASGVEIRLERFALHSASLVFVHPVSKKEMKLEAPLAEDFSLLLTALREGREIQHFALKQADFREQIIPGTVLQYGSSEFDRL